ncbi:MAG: hypothetical protein O3C43_00805 [Verrucomicrobia bacterium]|nr:hypothetical protein [Verrucomicrobiota bacterium]MDA1065017.1 hypothetical protein [Verrucomicrobiota bacterium]
MPDTKTRESGFEAASGWSWGVDLPPSLKNYGEICENGSWSWGKSIFQ